MSKYTLVVMVISFPGFGGFPLPFLPGLRGLTMFERSLKRLLDVNVLAASG
jgi:hypothetical protein